MSWPTGIPKTRFDRGQELANIWSHILQFTTPEEREKYGISEDRSPQLNVMRTLNLIEERYEK